MLNKIKNNLIHIFILVYSFILVFLHSFNSVRFDDYSIYSDNAIFYSIGKALLYGKVLYKDIFDHKTPYIYFINAFASIFSYKHIGLYILSSLILFVTLIYVYKISRIVFDKYGLDEKINNSFSTIIVFIIAFLLNNANITLGVVRTEAYAVMFMLIAFYIYISGNATKKSGMFIVGICAGMTFMTNIRATILFVPYAIFIAFNLLREKKYKKIFDLFLYGLIAVILTIVPYIIYMLLTNSFKDMCEAVFNTNLLYADNFANVYAVKRGIVELFLNFLKYHKIIFALTGMTIVSLILSKDMPTLVSFLIANIYIIFSNRPYTYYNVIFIPFYINLFINILVLLNNKIKNVFIKTNFLKYIFCILLFILNFIYGYKIINYRYNYNKNIGIALNEKIKTYYKDTKTLKVLATGFNSEMYAFLDNVPAYKYFIVPELKYDIYKKPYEEQYKYIVNKEPDIIIFKPDRLFDEYPLPKANAIKKVLTTEYKYLGQIEMGESSENLRIFIR